MPGLHPDAVLHDQGDGPALSYSCCEHYAGDEKKLTKAFALQEQLKGEFDVTADLEDGAAAGQELEAARLVAGMLAQKRPPSHRAGCRVHPVSHPHFESDVQTLLGSDARIDYITIPKVSGITELSDACQFIRDKAQKNSPYRPPLLQVLIEDEKALHQVFEIAAHPDVGFISFGQMDFTSSHRGAIGAQAMKSPGQFDHPLMRRAKLEISAACHAHGKTPTHNPTTDYASQTQAHEDALRARHEFGFRRMWSIHPAQVGQILKAFAPTEAEVQDAARILLAAQEANWGPIADQGLLHDRASYRYYWALLKSARTRGGDIPAAVEQAFFKI